MCSSPRAQLNCRVCGAGGQGGEIVAGVFINYRVIDNPLGAAGIHEGLVRRFGADRVFRDCVSMGAGTYFPTAIRAAVMDADVIVSVIGPRWLDLRDEVTGVRLIDRDDDWVRQELALAIARGIHIVPVLLKDTPDNATLPRPAELPEDIRRLAMVQTFPVSQRRFGEDLDRLATALVTLVPSIGPAWPTWAPTVRNGTSAAEHPWPLDAFYEVVDALERVPCMVNTQTRSMVVDQLRPDISSAIQYHHQRRVHVASIFRTCLDYEGGVAELVGLIAKVEQARSLQLQRLLATLDRVLPPNEWGTL